VGCLQGLSRQQPHRRRLWDQPHDTVVPTSKQNSAVARGLLQLCSPGDSARVAAPGEDRCGAPARIAGLAVTR